MESAIFNEVCNICGKNGHNISRCCKRQTNKYRQTMFGFKIHYDAQGKCATLKVFKDFFQLESRFTKKRSRNSYNLPHK